MARKPNRSPESIAKQRAYTKQWHLDHPDYKRNWSKANRTAENERHRAWRAHNTDLVREQKRRYYEKHPRASRAIPGVPAKFLGHDFFDTARFICGPEPYFMWNIVMWEEAMANVVLALVEGRDPNEAYVESQRKEREWIYHTGPIYDNVDIQEYPLKAVIVAPHDP